MSKRPNLILFNPDQWRGDVLGHAGNPAAVTPVLDRLVETDAVSFRNAFCQNPVCTPSRCSFMTGWYPHTRGHRTMFHMLHADRGEPNLLRLLKQNGYRVWWGGKNDLVPAQDGFAAECDVKFAPAATDYQRWGHTPRADLHHAQDWRGEPGSDTYYSFYAGRLDKGDDDLYCDSDWAMLLGALDFIRDYDGAQPFCLYLPLLFPHVPYGVEEPYFSRIDRSRLPARTPVPPGWAGKPALLKGIWERQHMQGWTEERWAELRATYYGMCARLDHQFGLLIDALKARGLYDDTALFFFSDHGDFTGDYGLVEKTQNTFEDCLTRVPFIVKPPKGTLAQPRVSDALVELVDFAATVYDLAGIEPGYTHFGRSLLPLIAGETDEHRDAVFCEGGRLKGERQAMELESASMQVPTGLYWPRVELQSHDDRPYHGKAVMCRTRDFKYVRRLYEPDELYDLHADPRELRNVVNDPACAGALVALKERALTWYMETCDVVPFEIDVR
jgi:arylsulfatase A-like enzyme